MLAAAPLGSSTLTVTLEVQHPLRHQLEPLALQLQQAVPLWLIYLDRAEETTCERATLLLEQCIGQGK